MASRRFEQTQSAFHQSEGFRQDWNGTAWLVLNHDGTDLLAHKLRGEVITIGRVPLNQVVIDNPTISAQHALLARLGDSYWLEDLHSTNGTQVNGVSITDAELNDGDKIQFGSVVAIFMRSVT